MNKLGRPPGTFKGAYPRRINRVVTKTYQAWQGMIARCHGNHPASRYYKGKGIEVCAEWRSSFDSFFLHIGEAPPGMWLDRIDNSKGYCPGNVRWVTPKESANNRTQPGKQNAKPMSLRSICHALGVPYLRTYMRIETLGWTYDEAFREVNQASSGSIV
jgi:hypothetical protein